MNSPAKPAPVASFSRAAHTYREHAYVQKALADWLAAWAPTDRIGRALEIGAGPGILTERLVPWFGEFLATDLSPAMCDVGRSIVPAVRWQPMAAEAPTPGPWNWIFSSSMLQWVEEPSTVFAAWGEQLAPAGRVLGGLFIDGSLPELNALTPVSAALQWRNRDEWRDALERAGLVLVRDGVHRHTHRYASALDLWRSLHRVGAVMPPRFSAGELRRLIAAYEAAYGDGEGVTATWMFYRFEAERR